MRPILLLAALLLTLPLSAATTRSRGITRRGIQKRGIQRRGSLGPARQRRLSRRRGLSASAPGSGGMDGQAPQGYRPPGVSYDAPTHGTKTEDPGSGQWQPGFGSISGQRMQPLGGAGVGGPVPAQTPASSGPAGSSAAGGNAITPNN